MELITAFCLQLLSTVGVIALFGLVISLLRRAFCAIATKNGPRILLLTGIVGTPIHELSHALMCLVFGHKISEIKLYQPNSQSGALGYVSHNYNKKNLYHQIGNFFIGTAPILVGGGVIMLLMSFLTPSSCDAVMSEIRALTVSDISEINVGEYVSFVENSILAIFSSEALSSCQGWVFIILAIMISTHMEMSGADIKNSSVGFLLLALILLLSDGILYLVSPDALCTVNNCALWLGLVLSAFLTISILFLIALLLLGLLCKAIASIFNK